MKVMKVSNILLVCLLTLMVLSLHLVSTQAQERTAYALQSRRGNEGVSIVVNVNINPHRKKRSAKEFPVDETTKNVVSSFKEVVSSKDEVELSETYLEFANKIKDIADQIDKVKTTESEELKQQLLAIVKDFTLKSEHPSVDILQSSLSDISKLNENQPLKEQQQPSSTDGVSGPVSFEETSGTKSLWIGQAVKLTSLGMNIVDGIGTYSDKISKAGKFLSGPVANKLDKWGMGGVASKAKKWGSSVDNFSQNKLKPIETRVANKIAPVVKSKTFQAVRRTLNVVSGAISLKGGLKALGMARNVKLPKSYKALKTSLTKATKLVKNRKQLMNTIRKTVTKKKALNTVKNVSKTAAKNWKNMKGLGKLKTLNDFRASHSFFKAGLSRKKQSNPSQKKGTTNNQGARRKGGKTAQQGRTRSSRNRKTSGRSTVNISNGRSSRGRSSSKTNTRSRSTGARSSGARSSGKRSNGRSSSVGRSSSKTNTRSRSTGARSSGSRSTGKTNTRSRSTGARSSGARSSGSRSSGRSSTSSRSSSSRSSGSRSSGSRSSGGRSSSGGRGGRR